MEIPSWFWMIVLGVTGQSLGTFWLLVFTKALHPKPVLKTYIVPLLTAAGMHGLSVGAVMASFYYGFAFFLIGAALFVLAFIPMNWARDKFIFTE